MMKILLKFPSPYGVLFILIILVSRGSVKVVKDFHLLTEYHSFLLYLKGG